jgi:hypothetical protein
MNFEVNCSAFFIQMFKCSNIQMFKISKFKPSDTSTSSTSLILKIQKAFVRLYAYFLICYLFNNQQHEYTGLHQTGR